MHMVWDMVYECSIFVAVMFEMPIVRMMMMVVVMPVQQYIIQYMYVLAVCRLH